MPAVPTSTVPLAPLWTGDVPVVTAPGHLPPHDAPGSTAAQCSAVRGESAGRFPTHWSRRLPYREKMSPIDHSET